MSVLGMRRLVRLVCLGAAGTSWLALGVFDLALEGQ